MKKKTWIYISVAVVIFLITLVVFLNRRLIRALIKGESVSDCPCWLPKKLKNRICSSEAEAEPEILSW